MTPTYRYRLALAYLRSERPDRREKAAPQLVEASELYVNTGRSSIAVKVIADIRAIAAKEALPAEAMKPLDLLQRSAASGNRPPVWETTAEFVPTLLVFPEPNRVVFGDGRNLFLWDIEAKLQVAKTPWAGGRIATVAHAPRFVAIEQDRLALWSIDKDVIKGKALTVKQSDSLREVAVAPEGNLVASFDQAGNMKFWNAEGTQLNVYKMPFRTSTAMGMMPDGRDVIVAGTDGVKPWLILIERETGKATPQTDPPKAAITALAVSPTPTEPFAATGDAGGHVRLYRREKEGNGFVKTFLAHRGPAYDNNPQAAAVRAIAFHPQGKWLATLGDDHTVRIWDYKQDMLKELARFGHPQQPRGIAISPDGRRIAIAAAYPGGGMVRVWDINAD